MSVEARPVKRSKREEPPRPAADQTAVDAEYAAFQAFLNETPKVASSSSSAAAAPAASTTNGISTKSVNGKKTAPPPPPPGRPPNTQNETEKGEEAKEDELEELDVLDALDKASHAQRQEEEEATQWMLRWRVEEMRRQRAAALASTSSKIKADQSARDNKEDETQPISLLDPESREEAEVVAALIQEQLTQKKKPRTATHTLSDPLQQQSNKKDEKLGLHQSKKHSRPKEEEESNSDDDDDGSRWHL